MNDHMDCILGIRNRTENWKTVRHLSRFIHARDASPLAKAIVEADGGSAEALGPVHIELFWKGFRDYWHQTDEDDRPSTEKLLKVCSKFFGGLRAARAWQHSRLRLDVSSYIFDGKVAAIELFNNLRNTEIDIVLECPGYLLIGEAKDEADFSADSGHLLCHQLIRQCVMANVLVELTKPGVEVVPFVVTSDKNTATAGQAKLMLDLGLMKPGNVLMWEDVDKLTQPP